MRFDEDVYQDTMMRCLETLHEEKTPKEFDGYVLGAYNKNLWREADYSCNKYETTVDYDDQPADDHTDSYIDLSILYDKARKRYGDDLIRLFKDWLSGYSVREIEEKTGRKDLTYQFKKIREYLTKQV